MAHSKHNQVGLKAVVMPRGILALFVLTGMLAGCGAPDPTFVFNERTASLPKDAQDGGKTKDGKEFKGIKTVVDEKFGSPTKLVAWTKLPVNYGGEAGGSDPVGFSLAKADANALETISTQPGYELAAGRALYTEHCMHCHGTSGDGAGPTAKYLNPRPRDYRKGLFKFTSTKDGEHVTRDDLARIIKLGIPGTYMPSFLLLEDKEVEQIVEYVRWLAMRGELEYALGAQLVSDYSTDAIAERTRKDEDGNQSETLEDVMQELHDALADLPSMVEDTGTEIADNWTRAEEDDSQIVPSIPRIPDSEESRRLGRAVFISAGAKCTNCHGPHGHGDGRQNEEYEVNEETGEKWNEAGLHDKWGNIVKPRNLTTGIYRGGRRPIDIFRRVRAGIKGSAMPAFGNTVISDEDLWHLVNYVKSIPFGPTTPAPAKTDAKAAAPAPAGEGN